MRGAGYIRALQLDSEDIFHTAVPTAEDMYSYRVQSWLGMCGLSGAGVREVI
jgi:hypothetical protein